MSIETVYDRALLEVGPNGIFQKKFDLIYNVVLAVLWCMTYSGIFLVLVIPPHHCKIPEKPVNLSEIAWKFKHIPASSNDPSKPSSCLIYVNFNEGNETKECEEFAFDKTWYESTAASENKWICNKEIYVANIFAYNMVGETIGSIFFGWFGDVYGRRLTYIIALALIVLGRVISIVSGSSYLLFVCGCVIASFPSWSVVQSTIVLSLEISSPERRTTTATLRFTSLSSGVCLMALLYWWLREWRIFFTVSTATLLPYIILSWFIIESPRWLWLKAKPGDAIKILKRIAKSNGTTMDSNTVQDFLTTSPPKIDKVYGPLTLFSSWTLALNTTLQLSMWVCVSLSYVVLLMTSGEKSDGNPFLEFAWQAIVEIPGNFIGAWLANRLGRRHAGTTSFATTALMWILMSCRQNYLYSWIGSWWFGVILRTICRLSSTTSYYTINLFNMELYPTCLRQSGMSLGNVFSSGASAIAPYVMYLGRQVDSRLPGALLAGISVIGVLSSYFLPETLNEKLPETVQDAQIFGRGTSKTKLFNIPLRRFTKNDNEVDQ